MNGFRYWIADLISGGELRRMYVDNDYKRTIILSWVDRYYDKLEALADCKGKLRRIAALETPNAAPAARKMARIARGEA